mgnify:FL=1|tara:strand:+ start:705 stop:1361 length:657 start_codon:yes stop_codon:yes gene_type:complete
MSIDFSIDAEPRTDEGKGASRRLRRSGRVPAILYGGDTQPQSISLDQNRIFHDLAEEAFYSHILSLKLEGKTQKVILRDVQRHPAKPIILHVDFQRVDDKQTLNIHVPLHFIGDDVCPGVKLEGGQVSHQIIEVEITCLPKNIPEFIEVDVSELKIGDAVHLTDLKLSEGVTLTALTHGEGHDQQVANCHATKVAEEEPVADDAAPEAGDAPAADSDE